MLAFVFFLSTSMLPLPGAPPFPNVCVWRVDTRLHYYSEDTQQTTYLVDTSPELLLTDELSLADKPSSTVLQGRAKGHSSAGTWNKWVLNRISTAVLQQLQFHAHVYVHCVCSHPIRLGNRLRGYNMIGYGGHPVNVIFTTVFRTLEEKSDWVLLLLTHWRLPPSRILLITFLSLAFHSEPFLAAEAVRSAHAQ